MKNLKFYLIAVLFALSFSCKDSSDYLDPEAVTGFELDEVFTNALYTQRFLTDIYGRINTVLVQGGNAGARWGGEVLLEVATDNAVCFSMNNSPYNFNTGFWNSLNPPEFVTNEWRYDWAGIRACNMFLFYIDDVPENAEYGFNNSTRAIRKGECFFLKAFFYSEMFKQFGGLPLSDKVIDITDKMDEPRATVDETVAEIVSLCDRAAALLPVSHPANDYGRATKGAALALKARVLLYAASPLWNNSSKPEDSPFRGQYDAGKWQTAARAAADVINLNVYSLFPDISNLFITRENSELIFVRLNQPGNYMTFISIPYDLCPTGRVDVNSGWNQVTYNLVKEYEVLKDGQAYLINDNLSTDIYDPQNPFVNRDPRFYRDCMFNGFPYQGKIAQFGLAEGGVAEPEHNIRWEGRYTTYTYCIKFANLDIVLTGSGRNPASAGDKTNQNYPYLRYAEVLLNYAEAMNEAYGPEVDGLGNGRTALWAVNQVRTRSQYPDRPEYLGQTGGMPPMPTGMSQSEFRERLRRERRVEMAFEEHRFWDVRRWKIPAAEMTDIKGLIPIWGPSGVRYEIQTVEENRVFDARMMYRMPIPQAQINVNPNLVQNPGWLNSPESSE